MKTPTYAVLALLALSLANAGCGKHAARETFDVRGNWGFNAGAEQCYVFSFVGMPEEGTVVLADSLNGMKNRTSQVGWGSYSVSGNEIVFDFASKLMLGATDCHFRGTIVSETRIAGAMRNMAVYPPFSWTVDVEGRKL